ncbi:hypothetical protein [Cupriavidus plantarum]|uniref:hypothetical protein n=1 Tax=Cupriavidus plantarum TaxID=942865 RepID=UPI00339D49AB
MSQNQSPFAMAIAIAATLYVSNGNTQGLPPPSQSAALTNAEQDQRTRQQQESRERAAAINAPAVRGEAIARAEYPTLPQEAPRFRITQFQLEVPKDFPPAMQAIGASALPWTLLLSPSNG